MSLIDTIEADLKAAWGAIEGAVEADALTLWDAFKTIMTALLPEQYAMLSGFINTAIKDAETGDIGDIETALLNLAEVQEVAWVKTLGSDVLQAIIAVAKAREAKLTA